MRPLPLFYPYFFSVIPSLVQICLIFGGGCAGGEEDDENGDHINGGKVNGDVLQWRAATCNGAVLTFVGYNW